MCGAVKQRMRSVTNIQKITKAMKMVAASKMRIAQANTERSRGLVQPFLKLLGDMPGASRPLHSCGSTAQHTAGEEGDVRWHVHASLPHSCQLGNFSNQASTTETKLLTRVLDADVEKNLTVAITTDKGLCGGINSTVCRYVRGINHMYEAGALCQASVCIRLYASVGLLPVHWLCRCPTV